MARKQEQKSQIGLAVFLIAVIVLSGVWLGYHFRPSRRSVKERSQDDKEYLYKCDNEHVFRAMGRRAPRKCTVEGCGADAYVYLMFACPEGHRVGVLIRTDPDEFCLDGYGTMRQWLPLEDLDQEPCPECHTPGLMPAMESPG